MKDLLEAVNLYFAENQDADIAYLADFLIEIISEVICEDTHFA